MLSMPQRLQAAALEILQRVRIGLDLPSRSEVMALADRIESLGAQIATLEAKRSADAEIVAALREQAAKPAPAPRKPRTASKKSDKTPATKKPSAKKTSPKRSATKKAAARKDKGVSKKSTPKTEPKSAGKIAGDKKKNS